MKWSIKWNIKIIIKSKVKISLKRIWLIKQKLPLHQTLVKTLRVTWVIKLFLILIERMHILMNFLLRVEIILSMDCAWEQNNLLVNN